MNEPEIEKINKEIGGKFRRVEEDLAACRSAGELFESLLAAIERSFAIPFVWLSIVQGPETVRLLRELESSKILGDRLKRISEGSFLEIMAGEDKPRLANGDLRTFFRLMPPNRKYFIRSIALVPLSFHGRLIGSLNHGDPSPDRFQPGMDTALLRGLAARISERLEGLMTAEKGGDPAEAP
jgi:uncharacterized protein YigA (DUF484 family)